MPEHGDRKVCEGCGIGYIEYDAERDEWWHPESLTRLAARFRAKDAYL